MTTLRWLAGLVCAWLVTAPAPAAEARPNLVFILTDDLGINDLACYGRHDHHTPNLDRLAAQGTRFTAAYCAQPICSPSRAAILTGKTPARLHLTTYLPGRPDCAAQKVLHPPMRQELPRAEPTIAEYLREAGYATACIGKWHLGGEGFGPRQQGFDFAYAGSANTTPSATEGGKGEYDLTTVALRFVETNRTRPFFLYLAHNTPHIPYSAPADLVARNATAYEPVYAAVIEALDDTVGRLLAGLETLGLAANTLVIFTSDNGGLHVPEGPHARITHNTPFRAGKGFLYEGGLRIPLLVRWPGHVPAGRIVDTPVLNTDWLPTLLELAGQPVPHNLDGISLAGLMQGRAVPAERPLFWHFPHYNNQGGRPGGAVREGRWKFIESYDDGRAELYDLTRDPGESTNLAVGEPRVTRRLQTALHAWRNSVGAQTNAPNPHYEAARYRALYVDLDVSRYNGATAEPAQQERVLAWRQQMNAALSPRSPTAANSRRADGNGAVTITGERKQWHKITLTLDGPFASERDNAPNPFTDYAFTVTFTHASGAPRYAVPGYFAADGEAANTAAESGTRWRAQLAPDQPGRWTYTVAFRQGPGVAVGSAAGEALKPFDGQSGTFTIAPTDKTGRDFRAQGRLEYVGRHHLQFAGSKQYFLKVGADAPETLLAYADFDGTEPGRKRGARAGEAAPTPALHHYEPHLRDWRAGDPTWRQGRGKGLIGALNYLAGKGANAFSFLPYNRGGDGDNVWPFVAPDDKLHYDGSKLDQWGIVFDHATRCGLYLHFKLQETEIDDNRIGGGGKIGVVPESLDNGALGPERKLYCRELIARFAHALALNWNLGEENTQSTAEIVAMAQFIHDTDPYHHPIVIHTYPDQQETVYRPLLGPNSRLTGASLQNSWRAAHQRTLQWVTESARAGRPWVVANDEQNSPSTGATPDPGYQGFNGRADEGRGQTYDLHDIRKLCLWGTLMAGGAGVEYYFGYSLPQNDLGCEDWRSRDRSWDYGRIALDFFHGQRIPFWEMRNADGLVGNAAHDNARYCLAKPGRCYVVYLPTGGTANLDLTQATGAFRVGWFNPRTGQGLRTGSVRTVRGGATANLGNPPAEPGEDWVVVVRSSP